MADWFALRALTVSLSLFGVLTTPACRSNKKLARRLPFGNVESPRPGETLKGSLHLSGWAVAEKGVQRVDVYWDDILSGSTRTGGFRPDVEKIYPNEEDSTLSGFEADLDLKKLTPGPHLLTVQIRSNDDSVREIYRSPEIIGP